MITINDYSDMNPKMLSPLTLAFLGDSVFEILVREKIILKGNAPVNKLHQNTIKYVSAVSQSKSVESLLLLLTDEEMTIYKRGRNANTNVPKSASPSEYHRATGLETLFGYLYLKNQTDRILELFSVIWES